MRRLLAISALVVVAVTGCGGDDDAADGANEPAPSGNTVVLKNIEFRPERLTISVGDTVTWQWDDGSIVHDVKFDDFKSELQNKGTYRHTFREAGTFDYTCTVHPQMDGTIVVR